MSPTIPNESELSNADIPPLMTVFEVARVLRISTRSVWRLVTSSKLVEPIRIGGSIRWRRADLQDWIARGCPPIPSTSPKNLSQIQMIDLDDHGTIQEGDSISSSDQPNEGG